MTSRHILMFLALTVPGITLAQGSESYQCTFGELQRRVEILHETELPVPCEVHYYKDTEAPGERQVLWSATNQTGYCEEKAQEFITKLEGWGWSCGQGSPETMPAEPDDTEALTTAEEPESGESQ